MELASLFDDVVGEPEKATVPIQRHIIAPSHKPKSGPVHTLSREEYLRRKEELEAQYNMFPTSRAQNLNPDCYPLWQGWE